MKISSLFYLVILSLVWLISCKRDNDVTIATGSLVLSIETIVTEDGDGRIQNEVPAKVAISVNDADGNEVFAGEQFDVDQISGNFLIQPIILEVASYSIEEFLVLNADDQIIYATPLEGSTLASLVSSPLPVVFSISADGVSDLALEVISTQTSDPEDLGYSSLSFDVIPTENILVSVQSPTSDGTSYQFVTASLTVSGDSDSLYTRDLGDSINVVTLPTSFDLIELQVTIGDTLSTTASLSVDSINYHRTIPLTILFSSVSCEIEDPGTLANELFAYYPFNGNANDESTNNFNGTFGGSSLTPTLAPDKNGRSDQAYEFDGVDDFIDLSEDAVFQLGEYDAFSIAAWINPSDTTNGMIASKHIAAQDRRIWLWRIREGNVQFTAYSNGLSSPRDQIVAPVLNGWQHVAVTFDGTTYSLYQNGELKDTTDKTVDMLAENTTKTLIGATHATNDLFDRNFQGAIDEVRFYSRAISANEIAFLACD